MPSLLWFRRDLRLGDHPALAAAAEDRDVLACFVLDPRLETRLTHLRRKRLALRERVDRVVRHRPAPAGVEPDPGADEADAGQRREKLLRSPRIVEAAVDDLEIGGVGCRGT